MPIRRPLPERAPPRTRELAIARCKREYLRLREGTRTMPATQDTRVRIGVDLGGTKIEFVALEHDGRELHRHRIATPRFDYQGTVRAVAHAAEGIEKELGRSSSVGMGIPGTISTK